SHACLGDSPPHRDRRGDPPQLFPPEDSPAPPPRPMLLLPSPMTPLRRPIRVRLHAQAFAWKLASRLPSQKLLYVRATLDERNPIDSTFSPCRPAQKSKADADKSSKFRAVSFM